MFCAGWHHDGAPIGIPVAQVPEAPEVPTAAPSVHINSEAPAGNVSVGKVTVRSYFMWPPVTGAFAEAVARATDWSMEDPDHPELFRAWHTALDAFAEPPQALQSPSLGNMRALLSDLRLIGSRSAQIH